MEDYPRTILGFEQRFATEEACREYLYGLRWPEGFRCPHCGHEKGWLLARGLTECAACAVQTSVTAGTIFQDTHKPLRLWFRAIWYVTSQKTGVSALGLQRVLGLGSYETAWVWLHKLRRAMVRPGRDCLRGVVEVDETYIGGERPGKHGRGAAGKSLVVVAAEEDGAGIGRIRLRRVLSTSAESLCGAVQECVEPGQPCAYGRPLVLHQPADARLPARGNPRHDCRGRGGSPAAGPSRGFAAQALDAGHSSGRHSALSPGLLPGRVHVPLQPPDITLAGQAVLPPCAAGRRRRPRASVSHTRRRGAQHHLRLT